MPIPVTHRARRNASYLADDGTDYLVKMGTANTAALTGCPDVLDADLGDFPEFPANWKMRHVRIETTDGVDGDAAYHLYSRNVPCNASKMVAGQALATGTAIAAYEGCAWRVRGRIGEIHRDI